MHKTEETMYARDTAGAIKPTVRVIKDLVASKAKKKRRITNISTNDIEVTSTLIS